MASPGQAGRQTNVDRLYLRTVPSKAIVMARSFSLDGGDTNAVSTPAPTAPVILLRLGDVPLLANVAAQACHLIQDGLSPSKRSGSQLSFSAWSRSRASSLAFGERGWDEQITATVSRAHQLSKQEEA